MLTEYESFIKQFHRALKQRNQEALRNLLTDDAKVNLDQEFQNLDRLNLPLSEDINVVGISLEGSGEIIAVYYINRIDDQEYPMVAYLRRVGETIKLNHILPKLRK